MKKVLRLIGQMTGEDIKVIREMNKWLSEHYKQDSNRKRTKRFGLPLGYWDGAYSKHMTLLETLKITSEHYNNRTCYNKIKLLNLATI